MQMTDSSNERCNGAGNAAECEGVPPTPPTRLQAEDEQACNAEDDDARNPNQAC